MLIKLKNSLKITASRFVVRALDFTCQCYAYNIKLGRVSNSKIFKKQYGAVVKNICDSRNKMLGNKNSRWCVHVCSVYRKVC